MYDDEELLIGLNWALSEKNKAGAEKISDNF